MRRSIVASSVVALGLLVSGCKDDLRPVTAAWAVTTTEWQAKVEALKADDAELNQKMNGLCSTEGLDPANPAAKTCAELKVTQQTDKLELEALVAALGRNRAVVEQAMARGKLLEVSVLIDAAKGELTPMLARVTDNAQLRREASKRLQSAVTQEFEAAKASAIAAEAKAMVWKQAAADKTALELTDIRFNPGTSELETAEAGAQKQLQELAVWANSCPALTFSITAHTSKELAATDAKRLTEGRAAAVRKFLVENGVAPAKIVSAVGAGSKKPIAEEPEPASEAATTKTPADLEALRNKNRRLTIQAVTPCPDGERAEVAAP